LLFQKSSTKKIIRDIKKKLFNNKKKRSSEGHHGSSPKARSHSKPQLQIESLETKDSPDI